MTTNNDAAADRAVTVPDADAVERAAKALYFTDANPDPVKYDRVSAWKEEWEKHLAFYQSEGYDPEGFFPAFMLAKKALAAVPEPDAAAGDDLDADMTPYVLEGLLRRAGCYAQVVAAVDSASRKEANDEHH